MKFLMLLLCIFTLSNCSEDQNGDSKGPENSITSDDNSIQLENELSEFIPNGYDILDYEYGFLNEDSLLDCVVVLYTIGEDTSKNSETRPLLLLIRDKSGSLELKHQNKNAILGYECGGVFGDPFDGIAIDNGRFTIYHYGGSAWRFSFQSFFSYQKDRDNWFLDSIKEHSYYSYGPPDSTMETSIKTSAELGQINIKEYDCDKFFP